ncbi:signal peptide peptidase 2 [Sorghum bicolor]|nr:signal peptide peptidase 2 [Sorghum bicolor]OQU87112.1 hypothetical protein SORBI_3003G207500 [Sorghum bicolor]OQU87113.1 hypothetical protein SORBI_3003G207500 [Sorghum bicolor]|eukprot:XP_021312867.1 signal peptide peptidase 2 [Sorghum bicolor]
MLLSVFLPFKFLSKDLIIVAITAYFIRGIVALSATVLPSIKRFLTKQWNYKEVVRQTPLIHTVSVDFIKSWIVASIPGIFLCLWYVANKHCLANNVLGISSRIQGINMLSVGSFRAGGILLLLFPAADAAWSSSITPTLGDTVIPGIFVALALCIALPKCSKNRFFNCALLRYTVGLTVAIIIMNWFQAAQPALLYVVPGVIGLVVIRWLWNGEVKQDGTNQLMDKVWNWSNMYGTRLKKFDGWVLHHTTNEDSNSGEHDAVARPEDHEGGSEDAHGGEEDASAPLEDHGYNGEEDAAASLEDDDGDQDDRAAASEDSDDTLCHLAIARCRCWPFVQTSLFVLSTGTTVK